MRTKKKKKCNQKIKRQFAWNPFVSFVQFSCDPSEWPANCVNITYLPKTFSTYII